MQTRKQAEALVAKIDRDLKYPQQRTEPMIASYFTESFTALQETLAREKKLVDFIKSIGVAADGSGKKYVSQKTDDKGQALLKELGEE